MPDIYFSNYELEEETFYFLYIGELKNYGLNVFLKEALARTYDKKVDFIAVVPDIFEQYNYDNIIVINPEADSYMCQHGAKVSCRMPGEEFVSCVSESPHIKDLAKTLLSRQENLYVYMYESMPEMTLDAVPGITILGPASNIAKRLNSKVYQYRNFGHLLPLADFFICEGLQQLVSTVDKLWRQWQHGIFVTREYSSAGINSIVAYNLNDVTTKFREERETYLISRYIPHQHDPTVLAVVANEDDVYIAGVADQRIEKGTNFTGSTFPTVLAQDIVDQLYEYTRIVGKWIAREGYRGIFGCDYLVDDNGKVYFLEVNARKQGTTMEFCCTLEQSLPHGSPLLPELEYYSVTENRFPDKTVEMKGNPKNINWGTYNYKISEKICTEGYIPQSSHERDAFSKVAHNRLNKDFLILEHIGNDFVVAEGCFLGRIVALGHDSISVEQGLELGKKTIELTISKTFQG
jgi:hypothetical protein